MKLLVLSMCVWMMVLSSAWADEPFAVVELFASEGCSSCPPADELLIELNHQAKDKGQRVFVLDFQVDYWNNLGWIDPLSSPLFTKRQYQYGNVLGSSSVYTPQMIINGQEAFVGSDGGKARRAIEQALTTPSADSLALKVTGNHDGQVQLTYSTGKPREGMMMNIALVEDGVENQVTAGENGGRLLKHTQAVCELKTFPWTSKEGVVSLVIPAPKGKGHFSAVGFLQNKQNMKISAANRIDF